MPDALHKAFDFAQDLTKQVLTLSSGIIAITLTFLNGKLASYPSSTSKWLKAGWVLYLVSILFGVLTLMALSGNLERPNRKDEAGRSPSIYRGNIRVVSAVQLLLFLAATVCVLVFGFNATATRQSNPAQAQQKSATATGSPSIRLFAADELIPRHGRFLFPIAGGRLRETVDLRIVALLPRHPLLFKPVRLTVLPGRRVDVAVPLPSAVQDALAGNAFVHVDVAASATAVGKVMSAYYTLYLQRPCYRVAGRLRCPQEQ